MFACFVAKRLLQFQITGLGFAIIERFVDFEPVRLLRFLCSSQTTVVLINLNIIQPAIYVAVYLSRVADSQLLNGWCHGHENCRVCSRTRSHDSVIFSDSYFFSYGEFGDIKIEIRVEVTAIAAADNLGQQGQSIILR